jgi:hypothetical protein
LTEAAIAELDSCSNSGPEIEPYSPGLKKKAFHLSVYSRQREKTWKKPDILLSIRKRKSRKWLDRNRL